jgi:cell division protein FtsB
VSARAYRVAPRSRSRGGSGSRIRWDRLGRITLVVVLFVILALYINPMINFVDAWKDSRTERSTLADLRKENADLKARAEVLSDPKAAAEAARKLGMVGQGERSFVIRERKK